MLSARAAYKAIMKKYQIAFRLIKGNSGYGAGRMMTNFSTSILGDSTRPAPSVKFFILLA
jgi:hypothetical protein